MASAPKFLIVFDRERKSAYCPCYYEWTEQSAFTSHLTNRHFNDNSAAECGECNRVLSTLKQLKSHIDDKHPEFRSLVFTPEHLAKRQLAAFDRSNSYFPEQPSVDHQPMSLDDPRFDGLQTDASQMDAGAEDQEDALHHIEFVPDTSNQHQPEQHEPQHFADPNQVLLEFSKRVINCKLKTGSTHIAASSTFFDGIKFALELMAAGQVNDYNLYELEKLSKLPAKQSRMVSEESFNVESESVNHILYEWYYLSIESVVTNLINKNPVILSELISDKERPAENGVFSRFKDGQLYEPPDRDDEIAVYIDLYADDCRKPGSSTENLTVVYFVINNVPYSLQSDRSQVNLLMIATKKVYKAVGRNRFFRPILEELNSLKDRRIIIANGFHLKIHLATFIGDNLALNALQGIPCSFTNTRACRSCLVHYRELQTGEQFEADERQLTDEHLLFGIVDRPMLYAPDVLHDIIEGVLPKFLWLLIKRYYHREMNELNRCIKQVRWKNGAINEINLKDGRFKCSSGMQFLEFFVQFSILDWNVDDEFDFELYVNLRRILCIVMRSVITEDDLNELQHNVVQFLENFKKSFKKESITFKMHFMLHYAHFIRMYGPIWNYCTLRFERKHQQLLSFIRSSRNSVNLPKQIMRWNLIQNEPANVNQKFREHPVHDPRLGAFVPLNVVLKEFTEYTRNKIVFKVNNFYIISDNLIDIQFGRCLHIFEVNGEIKIIMLIYNNRRFSQSKFCYVINPTDRATLLDPDRARFCHITLYSINKTDSVAVYVQKTF